MWRTYKLKEIFFFLQVESIAASASMKLHIWIRNQNDHLGNEMSGKRLTSSERRPPALTASCARRSLSQFSRAVSMCAALRRINRVSSSLLDKVRRRRRFRRRRRNVKRSSSLITSPPLELLEPRRLAAAEETVGVADMRPLREDKEITVNFPAALYPMKTKVGTQASGLKNPDPIKTHQT